MASIKIADLSPNDESLVTELSEAFLGDIQGAGDYDYGYGYGPFKGKFDFKLKIKFKGKGGKYGY
jgi:hypothetical protein